MTNYQKDDIISYKVKKGETMNILEMMDYLMDQGISEENAEMIVALEFGLMEDEWEEEKEEEYDDWELD